MSREALVWHAHCRNKSQKTSRLLSGLAKGEGHETHNNNFGGDNGQSNNGAGCKRPGKIGSQLADDSFPGIWRCNNRMSADTLFSAFLLNAEGTI
jgi:hypothetical protein